MGWVLLQPLTIQFFIDLQSIFRFCLHRVNYSALQTKEWVKVSTLGGRVLPIDFGVALLVGHSYASATFNGIMVLHSLYGGILQDQTIKYIQACIFLLIIVQTCCGRYETLTPSLPKRNSLRLLMRLISRQFQICSHLLSHALIKTDMYRLFPVAVCDWGGWSWVNILQVYDSILSDGVKYLQANSILLMFKR